jgi:hypothetical protein
MDFTIDLILFTAIGILFLLISIGYKLISHHLWRIERLVVRSNSDAAWELATKIYKLHRDLKKVTRKQSVAQSRERKILKKVRSANKIIVRILFKEL